MATKPIYNGSGERISLHEHLEDQIEALEKHISARIDASEQHINTKMDSTAEANRLQIQATKEHFQLANEWRSFATKMLDEMVTKQDLDSKLEKWDLGHHVLEDRVDSLESFKDIANSKASTTSVVVGYIITAILAVITIVSFVLELANRI